ncbi:hypothetical protein MiSe_35310 [Microseira wollei NIES-4236]|uniref:Damage-control phosphatase ARMT1-like metal-binding domain-containing protein n=2 Tax=Microseira wollei TaxID=467598 RepID=A0AAV3XH14_9CYAN|nr:hypothetical protein MiSe_35310 [Microseira wollei NIES-4236]
MAQENSLSQSRFPKLPLPPQIMGSEIGSFAYNTVAHRLPDIAQRVIDDNKFPLAIKPLQNIKSRAGETPTPQEFLENSIVENLQTLIQELPYGKVRFLKDIEAPDIAAWNNYLEPYQGNNWLDIPWYFAEAYFYRRILEATNYFIPGDWQGFDPFENQKRLGILTSSKSIQALSPLLNKWVNSGQDSHPDNLIALLYISLWGNRADLSLWPAESGDRSSIDIHQQKAYVLADNTDAIANQISRFKDARIDFIIDNAGFELFGDLCLVDFLLATNAAKTIYLQLKAHPTFVSDAMIKDIHQTIEFLGKDSDTQVQMLASRWRWYIESDRLRLCHDLFWTSPLAFWEMPDALRQELSESDLILIKGDANYRRLLGDRHWPFTTRFEDIVTYFPAPMVALRTLKAELASGLQLEQIETLNREDPQWLTNGRWGVIQFANS